MESKDSIEYDESTEMKVEDQMPLMTKGTLH